MDVSSRGQGEMASELWAMRVQLWTDVTDDDDDPPVEG